LQIGSALGPYRILRLLGSGGMGAVWLADDTRLHRKVALKTLRPADSHDAQARERLMREARAAAALNHAHIAAVYDVLEHDQQVVIVFEYVEGETLSARLARDPLPAPEAVEVACQIAQALVTAHAQGIVHRDLKPANVIVGAAGQVKVLDFGIARLLSMGTTQTGSDGHTTSGPGFVGTPAYAAPEQMVSSAVDERADLYALGVMLFEMLSGRRPFAGHDAAALAASKLGRDAPKLKSTGQLVPPALAGIVDALLSRDREHRPSSAADVLAQLRAVYGQPGTGALAEGGRREWFAPALVAAAAAFAAVTAAVLWWPQTDSATPPPGASSPPVVAVLPLANMSGDPSRDFIAAGIAESLISSLAAIPTVTVLSRASVAEARGRVSQQSALAKDLGATYLVEGSVQESGGRLRVSLNLVRPDRSVAWGDNIEGAFERIFDLQSRLASALTSALSVRVSATEREQMNTPPTSSPDALAAYWRGQALFERRDLKGNLDAAIGAFGEAIRVDNRFALAHAALGAAYWEKYIETRETEWTRKAIDEGTTALRIAPDQPEVRYTLAVTLAGSGRPEEAIDELNRALAVKPNYDDARRLLGQVLGRLGRIDDSVAEYKKALASRPNSWNTHSSMGLILLGAARYDEAIDAFSKVTELQPDNNIGYQQLGTAYQMVGKTSLALENYQRAIAIRPSAQAYSNMGAIHYRRSDFPRAVEAYRQAIALRPNSSATHRNLGDALTKMARRPQALEAYLEAVRLAEVDLKVNPNNARTMASLAVFLSKADKMAAARQRITEALQRAPDDTEVVVRAAIVEAVGGDRDAALRHLAKAVGLGYSRTSIAETDEFAGLQTSETFRNLVNPLQPKETPR
jgi:tetratricopeptide (TPR) repeat protein